MKTVSTSVKKSVSSLLVLGSGLVVSLAGTAAFADENAAGVSTTAPAAITHAFEIGVAGGYAQGTGDIGQNMSSIGDIAGAGGAGELQLGYRLFPHLTLGVYGTFSGYSQGDVITDDSTDVLGASAGLRADWHFLPAESIDPWVSLSTGWRGLWLTPAEGKDTSLQGFEIARLQVGVDYRITPEVAISPVLGASVSTFVSQSTPGSDGYQDIDNPEANVFFFAGLMGRFDVFGSHVR